MAKFDESKVINALHPEKAEVGKKYWFSDSIVFLKNSVEADLDSNIIMLGSISNGNYPFVEEGSNNSRQFVQFLYPYEEPPKQRMTRIQFIEWVNKGNGIYKYNNGSSNCYTYESSLEEELNNEVAEDILIRTWDSEEWVEPTYEIYLRDCKGVTQEDIDDVAYRDGC